MQDRQREKIRKNVKTHEKFGGLFGGEESVV
jgi:hypothetical protein